MIKRHLFKKALLVTCTIAATLFEGVLAQSSGCVSTTTSVTNPACGGTSTISTTAGGKQYYTVPVTNGGYYTVSITANTGSSGTYTVTPATFTGTSSGTQIISVLAGGACTWSANNTSATLTYTRPGVTASISGLTSPICSGSSPGTATCSASGGSGSFSYQWSNTAGTISGATNSTYASPALTASTTYSCSVTSAGCSADPTSAVTVNQPSSAPTGVSGTTTICNTGGGTTLTATGGTLGTGANYQWGTGSTVGTSPISGATSVSYSVTPTATTTYWVEITNTTGPCTGTTGGVTQTVTVNQPSSAPTGISNTTTICNTGSGSTLTATGGTLGTGANYQWGTGSTVGTNPISGATSVSYSVTPTTTTTYWVEITNGTAPCTVTTGGVSKVVTVNQPSSAPTGITGTTIVCNGIGTTLTATGGTLGTGANYQWGTGSTVGTSPISGATSVSYTVTPTGTTTYWVEITNGTAPCTVTTSGVTQTVTVNTPPTSAALSDVIDGCNGGHTATVTVTGGTSPYNFTLTPTPGSPTSYTNKTSPFEVNAANATSYALSAVTDANGCLPTSVTGTPVSYPTRTLSTGNVSQTCTVAASSTQLFYDASGNLMVQLTAGSSALGSTVVKVDSIDSSVKRTPTTNPQSYLQRHFHITPTNNVSATVCLFVDSTEANNLNTYSAANDNHAYYPTFAANMSNADITKYDGGSEKPGSNTSKVVIPHTSITITTDPTVNSNIYYHTYEVCFPVSSFSGFYIGSNNPNNNALPVTLVFVTATVQNNKYIEIEWATASELNNSGFEVQRSIDGKVFDDLGWIDGAVNSNTLKSYSYDDNTAEAGITYYYRLKQVDIDGNTTYSQIVSASLTGATGFVLNDMVPNPANSKVNVNIISNVNTSASLVMTDMLGRQVARQELPLFVGYNTSEIDLSQVAAGSYTVTVYAGSSISSKHLIVTK